MSLTRISNLSLLNNSAFSFFSFSGSSTNPVTKLLLPKKQHTLFSGRMNRNSFRMASAIRASSSVQVLTNPDELIDSVETFIFDCDGMFLLCCLVSIIYFLIEFSPIGWMIAGVIWKGDSLISGVPETLDMLRSKVLPFFLFFHSIYFPLTAIFFGV